MLIFVTGIADFMILAKNTSQVASLKENITDAIRTTYGRLFTPVNANRCNTKTSIYSAETRSPFKPVNSALSRT
jgi:hypothetical protein